MRRSLLAVLLATALAGVAAGQSGTPSDDTPPAAATPPPAAEPPAAQPPRAPDSGEKAPDADAKPEATPKPEATQEPKDAPKEAPKAATKRAGTSEADALAQCLRDWDAGTHMTRQEWARVCRRVVSQRMKFLRAEP